MALWGHWIEWSGHPLDYLTTREKHAKTSRVADVLVVRLPTILKTDKNILLEHTYSILSNMDEKQLPVLHTGKKSSFVSPNSGQMTVLFLPDHLATSI